MYCQAIFFEEFGVIDVRVFLINLVKTRGQRKYANSENRFTNGLLHTDEMNIITYCSFPALEVIFRQINLLLRQ